jgi:formylglycine-generating enzyme required for sulfatase activity
VAVNAFGLYDMLGNAWQWCQDWWGENYYSSSPSQDPQGPDYGPSRVDRGGSWDSAFVCVLSANRDDRAPDYRSSDLGFRVVAVARAQ